MTCVTLAAQSRYIYRVITSVPTFFVRMLGKLLDACIPLDGSGWRLALTVRGTCRACAVDHFLLKKVGTRKRKFPQCLQRPAPAVSTLCLLRTSRQRQFLKVFLEIHKTILLKDYAAYSAIIVQIFYAFVF